MRRAVRPTENEAEPTLTSITQIAVSFGFFELGRFATYYRRMFGELPSTTLNGTQIGIDIPVRISPADS